MNTARFKGYTPDARIVAHLRTRAKEFNVDVPTFLRKRQLDQREPLNKRKFKKFPHYLINEETNDEVQEDQPDDHTLLYVNKGHPKGLGKGKDKEITMIGDAEFQLAQIEDVLRNKLTKRNVDVRFLEMGDVQKMGGDKVKQVIKVRNGIEAELGKKIQRIIKDSKLKVQGSIQGDSVRVTGAKRDDLQAAMALLKKEITDVPVSFNNFRD